MLLIIFYTVQKIRIKLCKPLFMINNHKKKPIVLFDLWAKDNNHAKFHIARGPIQAY